MYNETNLINQANKMLGYQVNQNPVLTTDYNQLMRKMINNCGDPYDNVALPNTKDLERQVLSKFYKLVGADDNTAWGYLGAGGTEGNIWGLYNGRKMLSNPVVLYSSEAHYSVAKAIDILGLDSQAIKIDPFIGYMDEMTLRQVVNHYKNTDIIVLATYGTTFTGAYDNPVLIRKVLNEEHKANNYIHLDGAFGVPYIYYLDMDLTYPTASPLDVVDSVSFSLHKFYGCPIPSAAIIAKKDRVYEAKAIEYISSHDSTICGSRPGIVPIIMDELLASEETSKAIAKRMLLNSIVLTERLSECGVNISRYTLSNCIVFNKPCDTIIRKYSLSVRGDKAHIWVMPHVTESLIDEFIKDLCHDNHSTNCPLVQIA